MWVQTKIRQTCDAHISELRFAIAEYKYPDEVTDQLLKDQYILFNV